jgi:S1-C subfamily serine protease
MATIVARSRGPTATTPRVARFDGSICRDSSASRASTRAVFRDDARVDDDVDAGAESSVVSRRAGDARCGPARGAVFALAASAMVLGLVAVPPSAHARNRATASASSSFERFVGERSGGRGLRRREKRNSFVRDAANAIGPAVVRIDSDSASLRRAMSVSGSVSEGRGGGKSTNGRSGVIRGTGCGLVIDAIEGYVVTNSHVVKSEENVKVTFIDGNVYDGEVKGVDTLTDIALIKLKPRSGHALPWATLGDSDNVEVGDYAIALGNPLGLDNSVTLGIISNVHRTSAELGITDRRVDFVQTDCAINPGNSGGPLVNEFSEVVALNTAIRADAEGIGFAIPINTVKRVVGMLANGEKVPHPFIGIRMVDNFTANSAFGDRAQELPVGTVIVDVIEKSPASLAGLAVGDVITAVDGVVMNGAQILDRVKVTPPGDSYEFSIFRPSAEGAHMHRRIIIRVGDLAEHNNRSNSKNVAEDQNVSPPGVGVRPPRIPRTFGA